MNRHCIARLVNSFYRRWMGPGFDVPPCYLPRPEPPAFSARESSLLSSPLLSSQKGRSTFFSFATQASPSSFYPRRLCTSCLISIESLQILYLNCQDRKNSRNMRISVLEGFVMHLWKVLLDQTSRFCNSSVKMAYFWHFMNQWLKMINDMLSAQRFRLNQQTTGEK